MGLVLCSITYRLVNKHKAIAAQTACVWIEPASSLHGVLVSRCVAKMHCEKKARQLSDHGPLNTWPYLAQRPSYAVTLVLGTGKAVCSNGI